MTEVKKVIVFNCIDSFGKDYEFAVICKPENVESVIRREFKLCTEIIDYKVISGYNE